MKNFVLSIAFVMLSGLAFTQNTDSYKNKQNSSTDFDSLKSFVENRRFTFEAAWASPLKGPRVNLMTHTSYLDVDGNKAKAELPYFGRAFSGGYSTTSGVEFDNEFETYEVDINEKKERIALRFKIRGQDDTYNNILTINSFKSASLSVTSNNKQSIRYDGSLTELKTENQKDK